MSSLLPRIVEVTIGKAGLVGRTWKSPQYIKFETERTSASWPSKAKVTISGVSAVSLGMLQQKSQMMRLAVGEGVALPVFTGDVRSRGVKAKISGPECEVEISASDGGTRYSEALISQSYPAGTMRDVVVADILRALALPIAYMAPLPPLQYTEQTVLMMPARDALTVALEPDAVWSIQDGAIEILLEGTPNPVGGAVLLTPQTGMIGSPEKDDKGIITIKSKIDPRIRPGRIIVIQSRLLSGQYLVRKVVCSGDSHGAEWESKITARAVTT